MQCTKPIEKSLGIEDCLACSGCITVGEPDKEKHIKGIEFLRTGGKEIGLVITPQSKIALFERAVHAVGAREDKEETEEDRKNRIRNDFRSFEKALLFLFQKISVIDSTYGSRALASSSNTSESPIISSMCPGVVAYVERSAHHLLPYLDRSYSPVEICAEYLRSKGCTKIVSLVMCKDKRMEAEWGNSIDFSITTNDFFDEYLKDILPLKEVEYTPETLSVSFPLPGKAAGGLFEKLLSEIPTQSFISEIRKENFQEITFSSEKGNKKISQIYGLPRVLAFTTQSKNKEKLKEYYYVELMICKGACLYGPSQGVSSTFSLYTSLQEEPIQYTTITLPNKKRSFSQKIHEKKSYALKW
ncbi:hypothetical protein NEFER02_1529 [Nematocida sp. LUAm2]|nr:hypothetical protein NEFER02_1529 [Nematocida sp. LUAm2]